MDDVRENKNIISIQQCLYLYIHVELKYNKDITKDKKRAGQEIKAFKDPHFSLFRKSTDFTHHLRYDIKSHVVMYRIFSV